MHVLIVGATGMGKTVYAKALARQYAAMGKPALVLTPFADLPDERAQWGADVLTADVDYFLEITGRVKNRPVFIDEVWRWKDDPRIVELATMGRHHGQVCHFISQRAKDHCSPNIRTNCTTLVMFKQAFDDCQCLYKDYVDRDLLGGEGLQKFQALVKHDGGPVRRIDVRSLIPASPQKPAV